MRVKLPAVLGIMAAVSPPRYVPISRLRSIMKTTQFEEQKSPVPMKGESIAVQRLYPPATGERAEMLEGDAETVAEKILNLLVEKGVLK